MKLKNLCKLTSGNAWPSKAFSNEGIPIIRINNLGENNDFVYWNGNYDKQYLISKGDILLSLSGTIKVYKWKGEIGLLNQRIVKIKPNNDISTNWLYYKLKDIIEKIISKAKSATIRNLSINDLKEIEIDLPNIEEQERIALILDRVQLLIDKREKSISELSDLQKSIFIQMFGDPLFNPYKWPQIKLKDIIKIEAGWSPICVERPRINDSQVAILKQSAITKGYFIPEENKLLPNNTIIKKSIYAKKDTLLFSRKNSKSLVGKTVYLYDDYKNLLIPDTIFNIKYDKNKISGVYLHSLFNDPNFSHKIRKLSSGSVESMVNISQEKLLNLEIIYPDFEKQYTYEEIIRKIYFKMEASIVRSQINTINLFFSFSQRAFRGETLYNIDTELESLLNLIDVEKKDSENDITILSKDRVLINRLLDRIKSQDFKDIWLYDKAKYALFRIMNDNKEIFQHEFDIESESTNTRVI